MRRQAVEPVDDRIHGLVGHAPEGVLLPPGATPIAVSEFYAKLENTGSLRSLPAAPKP